MGLSAPKSILDYPNFFTFNFVPVLFFMLFSLKVTLQTYCMKKVQIIAIECNFHCVVLIIGILYN
jgi:hypothetical protein